VKAVFPADRLAVFPKRTAENGGNRVATAPDFLRGGLMGSTSQTCYFLVGVAKIKLGSVPLFGRCVVEKILVPVCAGAGVCLLSAINVFPFVY
jgi:hypothetical protein